MRNIDLLQNPDIVLNLLKIRYFQGIQVYSVQHKKKYIISSSIKATPPLSLRDSEKILEARISGRKYGLPVSTEKSDADLGYDASLGYR